MKMEHHWNQVIMLTEVNQELTQTALLSEVEVTEPTEAEVMALTEAVAKEHEVDAEDQIGKRPANFANKILQVTKKSLN